VVLGTEQINVMMHNTLYVPGHFHGTVVAGTTLAFMAVTYLVVPLIFRRHIMFPGLAKIQPYLFGLGVLGLSVFMMGAGTLGVARRHWDMSFADAALTFNYPPTAFLMMTLNGLSGILAALGGLAYIVVVVSSVFFGKKVEGKIDLTGGAAVSKYGNAGTLKIPGTAVLVAVFFTCFVLYYFVNWKYLSELWPLK